MTSFPKPVGGNDPQQSYGHGYEEGSSAAASGKFFYTLDSYCDERVDPQNLSRIYLNHRGFTIVRIWSIRLKPGTNEFQRYNALYNTYGDRANFVAAVFQNKIERMEEARSVARRHEDEMKDVLDRLVQGGFSVFGGEKSSLALIDGLHQNAVKAQIDFSARSFEFQDDRHPFCVSIQTMAQKGNKYSFPNVVMDNAETRNYLMNDTKGLPRTLFLKDGRLIGELTVSPEIMMKEFLGVSN